ncbi:MFS multidrug transporter [Cordyceps fumosorosea ARSEF 2679]|uniref:MFS multidrug transporter n=1 Tax=Cordyceps fumosorosea (strain ARSEF 2679) TaxID=1081104 RepID=A0A168API1_CORFA|nr:MFS multidrug transporter [Cordyceps fumosorosea ARSEF 2679]OAA69017.1 MFS multidrug transporter [Cordyceps fumosorosea ARSEF 2679]
MSAAEPEKQDLPAAHSHSDDYDPERHERPGIISSSSDDDDYHHHDDTASSRVGPSLSPVASAMPRTSRLSRTVSEVRDGMLNQRDLEIGEDSNDGDGSKEQQQQQTPDPNLVTWDGPDDKENPKNWSLNKKWMDVLLVSLFTFISPISSSMVAPALPVIGEEMHITGRTEQVLVMSIFVAAYAVGPLLWGPLSELYGRVLILQASNVWFFGFNLGCALARTEGQMVAFRFLAGLGGSAPLAIGGGILGDLFAAEQRGKAMSVYSLMPLLGPAIGPVAGGWIAQQTSWRWVFWSTTIACGLIQAVGLVFLRETYAPVLLHRKRVQLVRATGNAALRTEYDHPERTLAQTLGKALTRPFRLLGTQLIVQILALYMTYLYGTIYILFSSFPTLFAEEYHERPGIQGLNYISIGLGFFLGTQVCAPLQDRIYAALKRRYVPDGGPGRPEFRVPLMVPGAVLVPVGLLIYAWTAEYRTHWIGPNIGALIFSLGSIIGFQCVQGYLVDTYTRFAASAVGAATVLRSLAGFGFPLFAPEMYQALGYGKGGTILAVAAIVVGWPAPILLWYFGAKWRAQSKFSA